MAATATNDVFVKVFLEMMKNPPDPNDPGPLSNRKETMYGVVIPFHIISWATVVFRLYTRFRIQRNPGWDDLFVVLAAIFNLIAMVCFLVGINYGMGKHLIYIPLPHIERVFTWLYIQNGSYHTTSFFIKVSLLCQYLRLFRNGILRTTCWIVMVLVCLWGAAYCFLAWFPCFPVRGFWDRSVDAKCYAFGMSSISGAMAAFTSFAATNMAFDTIIFLIPLTKYFKPGLGRKEYLALTALFSLGSIVVILAALRLWSAANRDPQAPSSLDFTWWYPITLILACLEVDFALMCASMPIFWPVLIESFAQILVVQEVRVTHHRFGELDSPSGFEMGRTNSIKSSTSTEGLTSLQKAGADWGSVEGSLVRDHNTGKAPGVSEVEIQGQRR
ncbi:hypothetical protein B0J11DRAFT_430864 [Dendryphion nanum]|uniref:Rhodopsin domain-containing protein n=1 Tax=Dendryphion nanum TaxID=256645 RepID=A0A9P9IR37_9PLEO|nr:hypothetical protein B0J11DRAFT_430864 [Dendryphion nanum]